MKVDDVYEITRKDIAEELDGLPPIKMHLLNLATDALKAAIDNFRGKEDTYVEVEHRTCEASELKIIHTNHTGRVIVVTSAKTVPVLKTYGEK